MRYFFDTEFYEDGRTIELISIGVVAEDGREFYAENSAFDWRRVPDDHWLWTNVRPHLTRPGWENSPPTTMMFQRPGVIAPHLLDWVAGGVGEPEFWAYYADYDWVVLCQLYGTMVDLPAGWPMFCLDIKQLAFHLGNPHDGPKQVEGKHNALADARHNKAMFDYLEDVYVNRKNHGLAMFGWL